MPKQRTRTSASIVTLNLVSSEPGASHFVRNLRSADPGQSAFKVHAAENEFPDIDSWAEMRSYLLRTGAQHEMMVGARIVWREFQRR